MELRANNIMDIVRYFQSDEKPLTYTEFTEFWNSLDFYELRYFYYVDLETGLSRRKPFIGAKTRADGVRSL